jgi:catechol 2,3-dioxygenase-like lactoylglutathione lyase family enzyme
MDGLEAQLGAINLIVADLQRSTAFYQEVFGVPAQHQDDDTTMFRFDDTYVFLQRDPARRDAVSDDVLRLARSGVGQFVTFVDDADAVREGLDQLGVRVIDGPADRPWGMRTMTFADPGGYTWEVAQRLNGQAE